MDDQPSAVGQGLLAIGDQWTLLIIQRALLKRIRRFAEWRDGIGVSESVLTQRIKEMVAGDLLRPHPYRDGGRTRTEYLATARAVELWPMLVAIWSWERTWVAHRTPLPELVHKVCGRHTEVDLGCARCRAHPVTFGETRIRSGDATFAQVTAPRLHRRTVRTNTRADPASYFPETMEILADRWSTVVLAAAFLGIQRFADFRSALGISPSLLSNRLQRFTELDVLAPIPVPGTARRGYSLTPKGQAFFGAFAFLVDWAQHWYSGPPGTDLTIVHGHCGQPFAPRLYCRGCGEGIEGRDICFELADEAP
ncbi:helix-turn-helix transcriptional regulator [Nocardia higoensis]|uniref:Helix-turn-helix transcriptional regulator n=1 Tax=Nocardia higoensis TaxID=228599 RepID=A0ABS0D3F1_9NOCA|nr:helix-turn-helix domain-containing protein [Nocardia higoensis]MBF6353017.1 helix-turn-helix transcriptional regulator [Nocardia higoensis]